VFHLTNFNFQLSEIKCFVLVKGFSPFKINENFEAQYLGEKKHCTLHPKKRSVRKLHSKDKNLHRPSALQCQLVVGK